MNLILFYNKNILGKHETSSIENFSYGIANRGCSIRIPRTTEHSGKGYYEDRRPAANIDPYVVCSSLFSVTCLNNLFLNDLEKHYNEFLVQKNNNQ